MDSLTPTGGGGSGERSGVFRLSLIVCLSAGLHALWSCSISAQAQSAPFATIKRQAQAWNDQLSTDTTPIAFSIGAIHYTVPRNYIVGMDNWSGGPQTLVRFKVAFPGFEPFTERNRACMTAAPLYGSPGCTGVEFFVRRGDGDVSDDERFSNARKHFHSQIPLRGPGGFELYETGPANARMNTYRMKVNGHTWMIHCFLVPSLELQRAVCTSDSLLPNGDVLNFHLYGNQLELAEHIDAGFRHLIVSFTS